MDAILHINFTYILSHTQNLYRLSDTKNVVAIQWADHKNEEILIILNT